MPLLAKFSIIVGVDPWASLIPLRSEVEKTYALLCMLVPSLLVGVGATIEQLRGQAVTSKNVKKKKKKKEENPCQPLGLVGG